MHDSELLRVEGDRVVIKVLGLMCKDNGARRSLWMGQVATVNPSG